MFSSYLKMERSQSVKKDGTKSKTPRYVVTAQAGYFKPLQAIKNAKEEIVMFWIGNEKGNNSSKSETRLQCRDSINFSSIYFDDLKIGEMLIGYGEPPAEKLLKPKMDKKTGEEIERQNPFYENGGDGYLFILAFDKEAVSDYEASLPKTIEILVVPKGRQLIRGYAAKLADGQLNEALNELRKQAK